MNVAEDERREKKLRQLAKSAGSAPSTEKHVGEPLLALVRTGDLGEDIDDAVSHIAACADCRARLTEGELYTKAVVVMAIEAPRGSQENLAKTFGEANARLVERGDGRWTAVVPAEKSESLVKALEDEGTSRVSRFTMTEPVEVPLEAPSARKANRSSLIDAGEFGTDAAEVQAWAQVARAPRKKVAGPNPGWTMFAVAAVLGAVAIAYVLATR